MKKKYKNQIKEVKKAIKGLDENIFKVNLIYEAEMRDKPISRYELGVSNGWAIKEAVKGTYTITITHKL